MALSFISIWTTPFSISWRASLGAVNSLIFYLSGNVSIFPPFLKYSFERQNSWLTSFFFQHFMPSGLDGFWCEIGCYAYWGFPHTWQVASLLLLSRFSLAFDSLCIMSRYGSLYLSYLEFVEILGFVYICLSLNLGIWRTSFFKYSFASFSFSSISVTPLMHMIHLMVPHRSLRLCSLSFILFFVSQTE